MRALAEARSSHSLVVFLKAYLTWLKGVGRFEEFAVFGDAAADACGEGEIDGFAWFAAKAGGFVKSSEIGIVGEENFGVE